jgi:Trk K+ transport system NAD-binding subunit
MPPVTRRPFSGRIPSSAWKAARITWRKARAGWRDTILLLREFRQPLLLFTLAITGSGWLYFSLAAHSLQSVDSPAKAIYIILTLTFLQASIDFPPEWYLQVFFFLMPVIGIGILAQGLTDFGVLLFNRRARGKEWEMAVASTFSNHVVLIGLGHLGYRVVKKLTELDQDVVVIERAPEPDLLHNVRALGVPVLEEDGTRETVLINAGIPRARAIILCTQNDSLNLRMALKARNLNPGIEVVIRIFDDEFASSLEKQFGFHAMSATGMAAPLFAAIAAHIDITQPVTIEGQPHILARLQISPQSRICGMTVNALEEIYHVSIVLLCKNGERQFHPAGEELIEEGQNIAIFGDPEHIHRLLNERHR